MSTTQNGTANAVNTAISVAGHALVSLAETLIIADVPWLATPGLKQIWEVLFGWISGYVIRALETESTFIVIDLQVLGEENGLTKAFKDLMLAQKSGDPNAIKNAIVEYANENSALVNFDGSGNIK